MDVVAFGLAKSFTKRLFSNPVTALSWAPEMPSLLGWDNTNYPISFVVREPMASGRSVATPSALPGTVFDAVSTARTSPGATFYVDVSTGADVNAGTQGAPFKSIGKAVGAANTAGVPTRIFVAAGIYSRVNNPWYNGGTATYPLVDVAFVATGGRVVTGTFDSITTWALDTTYTSCYKATVSSANRVVDIGNPNRRGNGTDLIHVTTAAECQGTPDSWVIVGGVLYVNRRDRAVIANANTRVYRPTTRCFKIQNSVNVFIGGASGNDGFDCEGSGDGGVLEAVIPAGQTAKKILAVENCTFRYGGGLTDYNAKGVGVDSWNGLVYLYNCRADSNQTDGFNAHNFNANPACKLLTVNCTAVDNGRPGQGSTSCNGWTTHEDVIGIDAAGYYGDNHGGTIRCIDNTKSWLIATVAENDIGDVFFGGVIPPTAFRVDTAARFWCDRTRAIMPGGGYGYVAQTVGTAIHQRDVWPSSAPAQGPGLIDSY
jgi:hypothetical protein